MIVSHPATGSARPSTPTIEDRRIGVADLAESRLRRNGYLCLSNISCQYDDGVMLLRGHVPTYYLKQLAQEVVAEVEGVSKIVNEIDVQCPAQPRIDRF